MNQDSLFGTIESLPASKILPSSQSLRGELGPLDGLVSSIRENGLIQPIVVRPVERGFEVVAGSRRFAACKKLGMRVIPSHVLELDDKEAYEIALVENVQHRTLDPIDEAEAFRRYVNEYGYGGETELARKIGKSEQYVSLRLRLLSLPKEVLSRVTDHVLTVSHAAELLGAGEDDQKRIAELAVNEHISSREVRRLASSLREDRERGPERYGFPFTHSEVEETQRMVRVKLDKCITALKISMFRLDEVLDDLDKPSDWIVRETISQHRRLLHEQIDTLIREKMRLLHVPIHSYLTATSGARGKPVGANETPCQRVRH